MLLFLLHCKEPRDCANAELLGELKVCGFDKVNKKNTKFFRIEAEENSLKSIQIDKIITSNNDEYQIKESVETTIYLKESLFSREMYRLVVNDTVYDITDIQIQPKTIMMGTRLDSICFVSSLKINGKEASIIYKDIALTFYKPI